MPSTLPEKQSDPYGDKNQSDDDQFRHDQASPTSQSSAIGVQLDDETQPYMINIIKAQKFKNRAAVRCSICINRANRTHLERKNLRAMINQTTEIRNKTSEIKYPSRMLIKPPLPFGIGCPEIW